jgi:hypothetical protein
MPEENAFINAKTWEKVSQPRLEREMTSKFKKSFTETVVGNTNKQKGTGLTYQMVKGASYSNLSDFLSQPPQEHYFSSVKYTSQGNPPGTSPHSENGTQGKLDSAEAQGFVITKLKK